MADLYNLLDELDEHENEDAFVKERPSMAPTEATEGKSEWGSPGRSEAGVPLALQEARLQYEEEAENEGDASGDMQLLENELYGNLHRRWFQERHFYAEREKLRNGYQKFTVVLVETPANPEKVPGCVHQIASLARVAHSKCTALPEGRYTGIVCMQLINS